MKILLIAALSVSSLLALTPAERKIAEAKIAIEKNPGRADYYNALALALARRARETADPDFYTQGEQAVAKSLELQPDNFEALKMRVWLHLGKHEFAKARDLARTLNKRVPDDVLVYGFIADAAVELGDYDEAEKAAQWMFDLRPGNVPGLTRGAYLREIFGDLDGALDFMNQAWTRTRPEDSEDRAWIATHIAHLHLTKGDTAAAERAALGALKLFPDYHYALAQMGKIRIAQGKPAEAVAYFQKRYDIAPHPENLFDLAEAMHKAGRKADASKTFKEFETKARAEMNGPDNSNRELILYYLDYGKNPKEGLRIAKREAELRHDVLTLDAYAWALHKNGRIAEAREQMDRAVRVGTREPKIREHARLIGTYSATNR